jgi:hypothetical protein
MTLVVQRPLPPINVQSLPTDAQIASLGRSYDNLRSDLRQIRRGSPDRAEAARRADEWARCGGVADLMELRRLDAAASPAGWRTDDGDGEISRPWLSLVLGQLLGSFPTSNLPNATIFTRLLLEDVAAEEPTYAELSTACRRLRRTMKFMPSIAEVMEVLAEEKATWGAREDARRDILMLVSEEVLEALWPGGSS